MTNSQSPVAQDPLASLSSLQAPSSRENQNRSKASHEASRTHSPRTMASRKGNPTRSISSSICVEGDDDGSFRSKKAEDEGGDTDSLLKPSTIDFLGIGSQFGDHAH